MKSTSLLREMRDALDGEVLARLNIIAPPPPAALVTPVSLLPAALVTPASLLPDDVGRLVRDLVEQRGAGKPVDLVWLHYLRSWLQQRGGDVRELNALCEEIYGVAAYPSTLDITPERGALKKSRSVPKSTALLNRTYDLWLPVQPKTETLFEFRDYARQTPDVFKNEYQCTWPAQIEDTLDGGRDLINQASDAVYNSAGVPGALYEAPAVSGWPTPPKSGGITPTKSFKLFSTEWSEETLAQYPGIAEDPIKMLAKCLGDLDTAYDDKLKYLYADSVKQFGTYLGTPSSTLNAFQSAWDEARGEPYEPAPRFLEAHELPTHAQLVLACALRHDNAVVSLAYADVLCGVD